MSATTVIQTANNAKSLLFLNLGAVVAFLLSLIANALNSVGAFLGKAPLVGGLLETIFRFCSGFIRVPCYAVIVIAVVVDILLLLKFLLPFFGKLFRKMFWRDRKDAEEEETEVVAAEEESGKTLQVDVKEGEELHLF